MARCGGSDGPVALIFLLAMAVSLAMTTTDIALEALVAEIVAREDRPFVTTAKLVGSSLGTMVGVRFATAFPDTLSLPAALVAVLDAALVLPLLRCPEPPRRSARAHGRREPARTLGVPVFNTVYNWAEGERAATTTRCRSASRFSSLSRADAGPMLGAAIGWGTYFLVDVPFYALGVAALVRAMPRAAIAPPREAMRCRRARRRLPAGLRLMPA